jgi:hypothetical protein
MVHPYERMCAINDRPENSLVFAMMDGVAIEVRAESCVCNVTWRTKGHDVIG